MSHRVILASAGSGKTYRLVMWYLRLLHAGCGPETILATTFTRKAAGEILSRVLVRLADAARDPAKAKQLSLDLKDPRLTASRCRELLAQLCHSIHRLSISTIDSFFNRVAQSFRFELGIPAGVRIIDEQSAAASQMRAMAIDAMLGDEPPDVLLQLLRRLHHDAAKRSVTEAVDSIVSKLHGLYQQAQDRRLWCQVDLPKDLLVDAEIVTAIDVLTAMGEQVPLTKARKPIHYWAKAWQKLCEAAMLRQWEPFLENTLATAISTNKSECYKAPITDAWRHAILPLVRHARAYRLQQVAEQTAATYDLLHRYDKHIQRLKTEQRVMFFSDLSNLLARKLPDLGDDVLTEVYYRLDASVSQLLLDEFQDTSIDQWTVLKPLAEEVTAHADGSRTFFCVGDPKQSIYAWRGGCAELIEQLDQQLPLEEQHFEQLQISYRSSQMVLDAVNSVFRDLPNNPWVGGVDEDDEDEDGDGDESDMAIAAQMVAQAFSESFADHRAAKEQLPGYVEMLSTPAPQLLPDANPANEEARNEERFAIHARHVAERIEQIVRACPGRSLGVLTATNEYAATLIDLLRRRGLPASGEGGTALTDDPAVNLVLAALTLADHPGHSAAAFEVAQSPLAAVLDLKSHRPDDVAPAALRIRRKLLESGYGPTISDWARALAPHCNQRSVLRLTQLIEMADEYEPLVTLRPRHFVEHVRSRTVEEPTPAAIRVMTVHRSKGLEFDIVVLPQLHRSITPKPDVCVQRLDRIGDITAVFCGLSKKVIGLSPRLREAYDESCSMELRDDLCSLYVAMTRARHALHLYLPPSPANQNGEARSRGLSHASILLAALFNGEDDPAGAQVFFTHGDPRWFEELDTPTELPTHSPAPRTLRASVLPSATQIRRSMRTVSPSSLEMDGTISVDDLLNLEPAMQRVRGTVIHEWFALIDWLDDEASGPEDEALVQVARRAVTEVDDDGLRQHIAQFRRMLCDPVIRGALRKPAQSSPIDLWRERAFAVPLNGQLLQGRFDRVVIHCNERGQPERAELIDFKTDRLSENGTGEIIARYKPQIEAYRQALSVMLRLAPSHIGAKLLLVGAGLCVDVPRDPDVPQR